MTDASDADRGSRIEPATPPDGNTRHAFLVMAHADPELLSILLTLLDDVRNDIFLHVDAKSRDFPVHEVVSVVSRARVTLLPAMRVQWGGYSLIDCTLRLLNEAARQPHAYYHLVSGADLPLVTMRAFHSFFDAAGDREFVHCIPGEVPEHVQNRVAVRHYLTDQKRAPRLLARFERAQLSVQRRLRCDATRRMPPLRWGSQWFSITHGLASYVLAHESWIRRSFRRSVCGDEVFLQTLIHASPFRSMLAPDPSGLAESTNARLIDWSRGKGDSPYVWRSDDLPELVQGARNGHVLARKFSTDVDAKVITELSGMLTETGTGESCGY